VNKICKLFEERGVPVFFVELQASFEERLKRNIHPSRLEVKLLKKDINSSEKNLLESMQKYRLNSYEGEITNQNYLKIDNTNKTPDEVAQEIKQKFNL
jgi:chloramphenicol 3-O-phosphotransferase